MLFLPRSIDSFFQVFPFSKSKAFNLPRSEDTVFSNTPASSTEISLQEFKLKYLRYLKISKYSCFKEITSNEDYKSLILYLGRGSLSRKRLGIYSAV